MAFLNTIWLWGLAALAMPLAIHLLSRKEGRTIYIGSIRHLVDSTTTRFATLRLNEILLLLIRIVFVCLIVAFLSQLAIWSDQRKVNKWVLVEREMLHDKTIGKAVDSLIAQGYERRMLEPGFPTDTTSAVEVQNLWNLSADLTSKNLDDAIVFTYNRMSAFHGDRLPKPNSVQWIVVDAPYRKSIHYTQNIDGNRSLRRVGVTNSSSTIFNSEISNEAVDVRADTIRIQVYATPEFQSDARILKAALAGIDENLRLPVIVETTNDNNIDTSRFHWIFWLAKDLPKQQINNLISLGECKEAPELLMHSIEIKHLCTNTTNGWVLTNRLTTENILQENLTLQLAQLITSDYVWRDTPTSDNRAMPTETTWSVAPTEKLETRRAQTVEPLLAILILVTLLTERWLAMKRMQ